MKSKTLSLIGFIALAAVTVCAGALSLSVEPNFFETNPGGQPLGACHGGVAIDDAGNIYVTTDTPRGIVVYSSAGKFVRAFGPSHVHGLEIRQESGKEYIYAARPMFHEVIKINMEGENQWTITAPQEAGLYKEGKGFNPCAVTVSPDGSIFVADGYGSNHVLKFDKERKFVKAFGGAGEAEGKFNTCHGIAYDPRHDLLLVCNRNSNRVEHWDLEGNFKKVIQKDLRMPAAVHIRGDLAVFPELQGRVTLIDKQGNIVAQLGDNPKPEQRANFALPADQWTDGICNSPHGASIDKDGNVIVAEWSAFGHLHKFALKK